VSGLAIADVEMVSAEESINLANHNPGNGRIWMLSSHFRGWSHPIREIRQNLALYLGIWVWFFDLLLCVYDRADVDSRFRGSVYNDLDMGSHHQRSPAGHQIAQALAVESVSSRI
jgi:hypothetical protein